jgi:outer membrane biosynthesis protein TonB
MEVAGLQTQLKSLPPGETSVAGKEAQPDVKTAAQIGAEVARKEEEKRLEELFALEAKQDESNLPKRLVAYPQKSARRAALKRNVSKSLVAALVVTLAAAGLNWFGAFEGLMKKTVATKPPPSRAMLPAPVPSAQKTAVAPVAPSPDNGSASASAAPMESVPTNSTATSGSIVAADKKSSVGVLGLPLYATVPGPMRSASGNSFNGRDAVAAAEAKRRKVQPASELNSKPGDASNAGAASNAKTTLDTSAGVGVIPDGDGYVGPKLVHGVKPVAPAEALKNYVTGNVNLDALVDAAGHVKSVTVISGPAKLRQTAIEDMKRCLYEPAKKNGKAVSAHVQVSLQFWYEP